MIANNVGNAEVIVETLRLHNLFINFFQESNQVERTILNYIAEALDKTVMILCIDK